MRRYRRLMSRNRWSTRCAACCAAMNFRPVARSNPAARMANRPAPRHIRSWKPSIKVTMLLASVGLRLRPNCRHPMRKIRLLPPADGEPLFRFDAVSLSYDVGTLWRRFGGAVPTTVVSDASFELGRGETLALVGESGSGQIDHCTRGCRHSAATCGQGYVQRRGSATPR